MLARIPRGVALDVAAGRGRNALALARAGVKVVAVDFSAEAMRILAATARAAQLAIWPVVANLDSFHLKDESFDAIVNINFLDRALFPKFVRALRPGGVLIADTFLVDQATIGHPRDPRFLLGHGELRALADGLEDRGIPRRPGHLSKRRARVSRVDRRAAEEIGLMAPGMTYKAAGVDIALKQSLIPLFGSIAKTTSGAHVIGGVGGFGALVGLNGARKMRAPVLVAGTDSVGTKLMIAFETGRHDTVGIDCVAMCVNDIICHAARPLFFLDYIGSGKLEKKIALDLVKGVARGCAQAGMSLVGGETAQLSGLYKPGEYDLAGFAVGIVERARIPEPSSVRAGDVLIGLASSGLHSNGFSLVRRVAETRETQARRAHRRTRMHARRGTAASHAHLRESRRRTVRALQNKRPREYHRRRRARKPAARDAREHSRNPRTRQLADAADFRLDSAPRQNLPAPRWIAPSTTASGWSRSCPRARPIASSLICAAANMRPMLSAK